MKKILITIILQILSSSIINAQAIIGNTTKLNSLEIAQYDFSQKMTLQQAQSACNSLGNGWRLPTLSESKIIYQNKNKISNLKDDIYWCAKDEYGDPWRFSTVNGIKMTSLGNENGKYFVRAVKSR